jgi:hypothetical protein
MEGPMPRIMMTCPITKKPVFTGVSAPDVGGITENTMQCPLCWQQHSFSSKDVFLWEKT